MYVLVALQGTFEDVGFILEDRHTGDSFCTWHKRSDVKILTKENLRMLIAQAIVKRLDELDKAPPSNSDTSEYDHYIGERF